MSDKDNSKEVISDGKFVAYTYKLYNSDNGELLFEVPDKAPDVMVYGVSQDVVPGLVGVLKGLSAGDRFEVALPAEAAFGLRSEEWIKQLDKKVFMTPDGKMAEEVVEGAELPMMTDQGFAIRGKVTEISEDKVTMDFNHPFAGLGVRYEGEVLEVRDATPEELSPSHSCGGGCCGSGDCGDGDCGSHGGCGNGCGCH